MSDFVANIFELWGWAYLGPFSQYMYRADAYISIFLWLALLPAAVFFVYYILWDNIRFSKRWIWATLNLVVTLIIGSIAYSIADNEIYDFLNSNHITNSKILDSDYIWFALICMGWTIIWSFVLSFIMKFFSVKARHIPF